MQKLHETMISFDFSSLNLKMPDDLIPNHNNLNKYELKVEAIIRGKILDGCLVPLILIEESIRIFIKHCSKDQLSRTEIRYLLKLIVSYTHYFYEKDKPSIKMMKDNVEFKQAVMNLKRKLTMDFQFPIIQGLLNYL